MKRSLLLILTAITCASLLALVACKGKTGRGTSDLSTIECPEFIESTLVDFTSDISDVFEATDGRGNGDPFGVIWSKGNVSVDTENANMKLSLTKSGDIYYGGEIRTIDKFGAIQYGYFGCTMKPSNVNGTASTFFTYTGPYEDNPHDEIDIEFLGKDTTKVQFNYFKDGVGGNEYWHDLGFDASEDFHQYGFYWDEEKIIWYVDYKPVYCVLDVEFNAPQRVYTNFWSGEKLNRGIMNWMGEINDSDLPASTEYKKITVAYLNGRGLDIPEPEYVPSEEEFTPSEIVFGRGSTDIYTTVSNADGSSTITYTNVAQKSYKNVYGNVAEEVKAAEYVAIRIRNDKTDDYVKVRIDVQSDKANAAGIKAINEKAWMNGELVKTDLVWGGSFFDIQAGEEAFCVVRFYGVPSSVMLMIDSAGRTDKETFAGSITVSDFGYAGTNTYVEEYVTLSSYYELLKTGESVLITAEGSSEVRWTVENPNIVSVDNGLITALSEGTTVVFAQCGGAKAGCTVKVSDEEIDPSALHDEETLPICTEEEDILDDAHKIYANGTTVYDDVNYYGVSHDSTNSLKWSDCEAYGNMMFFVNADESSATISAGAYLELFIKNVGHTSDQTTRASGIVLRLYNGNNSDKVAGVEDVKVYKNYNEEYRTDAGNGWYYYKLPLSLFGSDGAVFDRVRIAANVTFDQGEATYLDGMRLITEGG